ncbi:hypothetical protein GCM10009663_56330 [Kitasatospora arboriphila]|uniref:Uncharacterized protein n=1 Tax=Kitasatospora arboriphila TaxID=258052 RepID=A0ABP4EIQ2_9ACTN
MQTARAMCRPADAYTVVTTSTGVPGGRSSRAACSASATPSSTVRDSPSTPQRSSWRSTERARSPSAVEPTSCGSAGRCGTAESGTCSDSVAITRPWTRRTRRTVCTVSPGRTPSSAASRAGAGALVQSTIRQDWLREALGQPSSLLLTGTPTRGAAITVPMPRRRTSRPSSSSWSSAWRSVARATPKRAASSRSLGST